MPLLATIVVLAYWDSRHPPRAPRPQVARIVLMASTWLRQVLFVNERGFVHGAHGTFAFVEEQHGRSHLVVTFSCRGGVMRRNTRWVSFGSGGRGFRGIDVPTARMEITHIVDLWVDMGLEDADDDAYILV